MGCGTSNKNSQEKVKCPDKAKGKQSDSAPKKTEAKPEPHKDAKPDDHKDGHKDHKQKYNKHKALLDRKVFIIENKGDIQEEYKFGKTLGKGAYGEVIEAVHKSTGQTRAIKLLQKYLMDEELDTKAIMEEFQILKTLDHPNVMKVFETFEDNKYLYVVNELLSGGEIFSKLMADTKLNATDVSDIIKQALGAVAYIHSKQICHRDIKPQNILLESKEGKPFIKLCDFGTAKLFKKDKFFKKAMGTPYFMAPEILNEKPYNYKVDIWSLGVMTYLLMTGRLPFKTNQGKIDKEAKYEEDIKSFKITDDIYKGHPHLSNDFKDFLSHCLDSDPANRWEAAKLLEHPWIVNGISKDIESEAVLASIGANIIQFNKILQLEHAVLTFLTMNSSKEDVKALREVFMEMDKSKDGKLSKEEFIQGMDKVLIKNAHSKQEIEQLFDEVDVNKSGKIGYSEFIEASINKVKLLTDKKLLTAFNYFDIKKDGTISKDELKEVFNNGGAHIDGDDIKKMIEEIDSNKDSRISFEEFKKMMLKITN